MLAGDRIREELKLEFAHQLYRDCLEDFGRDDLQTRLMVAYISELKSHPQKESTVLTPLELLPVH